MDSPRGAPPAPLCPVKFMSMKSEAHFTGACPVKFTTVTAKFTPLNALIYSTGAYFTGVAPADGTGVKSLTIPLGPGHVELVKINA